ncbi:MAG: HD domain-containing protein [Candidatus Shapirobacteria bacterium]|nr:HD domain-containing protein [Candidatus Shapirobacteria bacterium]
MEIKLPEKVLKVMRKFADPSTGLRAGEIFVVGGAVRGLLSNREVQDWDFTTNLTPEEMKKIFPRNSFCENKFGTFSIIINKDEVFEVTTYRTEQGYSDSRHPDEVKWGKTLQEDLMRRDFTINAMADDIDGNLTDIYGGQEDLKNGLVKTVGNPDERFREDALRMLRAIRIAAQLKFLIENDTFESIIKNAGSIQQISGERIREELFKILLIEKPGDGLKLLKNSGLLKEIMSEMLPGVDMTQKGHHIYDVWTHSIEALNNCTSINPITRLATLLHDVGKPIVAVGEGEARTFHNHEVVGSRIATKIGKRLKLSNKELEQLFILVRWHMFTSEEFQTDKAVRRFIRNVTPEYLDEMISLRRADRLGSGAKETSWRWELFKQRLVEVQKQPFSIKDLKVNGLDVMEILKIKPSRKVGEILEKLFAQVEEDPKLNEREVLLEKLRKMI